MVSVDHPFQWPAIRRSVIRLPRLRLPERHFELQSMCNKILSEQDNSDSKIVRQGHNHTGVSIGFNPDRLREDRLLDERKGVPYVNGHSAGQGNKQYKSGGRPAPKFSAAVPFGLGAIPGTPEREAASPPTGTEEASIQKRAAPSSFSGGE
jgi:hypothetical protein